jgi:hypothetical protein
MLHITYMHIQLCTHTPSCQASSCSCLILLVYAWSGPSGANFLLGEHACMYSTADISMYKSTSQVCPTQLVEMHALHIHALFPPVAYAYVHACPPIPCVHMYVHAYQHKIRFSLVLIIHMLLSFDQPGWLASYWTCTLSAKCQINLRTKCNN